MFQVVGVTHLEPVKELEIQHRAVRHIYQRVIAQELAADKVEATPEVGQSRWMWEIVASLSTVLAMHGRQELANPREQTGKFLILRALYGLGLELPAVLWMNSISCAS